MYEIDYRVYILSIIAVMGLLCIIWKSFDANNIRCFLGVNKWKYDYPFKICCVYCGKHTKNARNIIIEWVEELRDIICRNS